MKRLLYSALGLLFGLVLAFAALLGLAATEIGTRWLLTATTRSVQGISLGQVRGTLLKRLELEQVAFRSPELQLELGRLSLSWQPEALVLGQIKIKELTLAQGLSRFQSAAPSVRLPAVELPLTVTVERAELIDLTLVQKESRLHFDKVLLAAELKENRLTLWQLHLSAPPIALAASGEVKLSHDYPLELSLTWQGKVMGQAAGGKASLTGTLRELTIAHSLTLPFQAMTLGTLNALAPELPFDLHGSWQNLTFPKEFKYASPSGSYRVRGDLKAYRLELKASLHSQTLPPLKLHLNARGDDRSLILEPLILHPPKGELSVTGKLKWKPEFAWQFSLKGRELDPGAFMPELPGRLEIRASSAGRWNRPRQATLDIERLHGKLRGQAVELIGKLRFQNGRWQSEGMELKSGRNRLQLKGHFGKSLDLTFIFDGKRLSDLWPQISGMLNAQGRLKGSLLEPEIHLKAQGRALAWGENQIGKLALALDFAPGAFASRQILRLDQLKLHELVLEQVELTVRGSLAEHQGELDLKAPQGKLRATVAGSYHAGIWQTACRRLVLEEANGRQLAFPEAGSLLAQARLDFIPKPAQLASRLKLEIEDLAKLAPWLEQLERPQGRLRLELSASGPIRQPTTEARLNLSQGAFGLRPAGIRLSAVELKVAKEQGRWELTGSARSGAGDLKVSGWALPPRLHLKFSGTEFEIAHTLRLTAAASPELVLDLHGQAGQVTGTLLIPKASIRLKQLPEGSVTVSEDEILVGAEPPLRPRFAVAYKIQLILGEAVDFEGLGLKAKLSGALQATGKIGGQTYAHGTVDLKDASYQAYGQKLTLDKGRLIFTGPWEQPYLELRASRTVEAAGVRVFLEVQGPAQKPTASVTSQPPLPQTEALSYLFLGRSFTTGSASEQAAVAKAALAMGVELALPWLKKLGLEAFAAKTGTSLQEDTLGLGKYLTPELYIGYAFNLFNGVGKALLRYRINRFLSLEAGAGAGQNVDLFYTLEAD